MMNSIKEKLLNYFFPIGTMTRVLCGQFLMPEGMTAILVEEGEIVFIPENTTVFSSTLIGVDMKNLRLTVMQSGMHLYDIKNGVTYPLNWREQRQLRAAALDWLQIDGVTSQFRTARNLMDGVPA